MQFSSGSGIVGFRTTTCWIQVALPGDSVTLWVTGVNCTNKDQASSAVIRVGGNPVEPDSFAAVPERPGTCALKMRLPETRTSGEAVPVTLELIGVSGQIFSSNTTSVAVGR